MQQYILSSEVKGFPSERQLSLFTAYFEAHKMTFHEILRP